MVFISTGAPRGYWVHLGSTGCTPVGCAAANRPDVDLKDFDPARDTVVVDLAALLDGANIDVGATCMSGAESAACAPLFTNCGLPFGARPTG